MNPEKQKTAIAEACGWKCVQPVIDDYVEDRMISVRGVFLSGTIVGVMPVNFQKGFIGDRQYHYHAIPDYPRDLNACHEMEKVLTEKQKRTYAFILCNKVVDVSPTVDLDDMFLCLHATAAQRCEAFLRTLGKWEDES